MRDAKITKEMIDLANENFKRDYLAELEKVLEDELKKTPEYIAEQKRKSREEKIERIFNETSD